LEDREHEKHISDASEEPAYISQPPILLKQIKHYFAVS